MEEIWLLYELDKYAEYADMDEVIGVYTDRRMAQETLSRMEKTYPNNSYYLEQWTADEINARPKF